MERGEKAGAHPLLNEFPERRVVVGEAEVGDDDPPQLQAGGESRRGSFAGGRVVDGVLHALGHLDGPHQGRVAPLLAQLHRLHHSRLEVHGLAGDAGGGGAGVVDG